MRTGILGILIGLLLLAVPGVMAAAAVTMENPLNSTVDLCGTAVTVGLTTTDFGEPTTCTLSYGATIADETNLTTTIVNATGDVGTRYMNGTVSFSGVTTGTYVIGFVCFNDTSASAIVNGSIPAFQIDNTAPVLTIFFSNLEVSGTQNITKDDPEAANAFFINLTSTQILLATPNVTIGGTVYTFVPVGTGSMTYMREFNETSLIPEGSYSFTVSATDNATCGNVGTSGTAYLDVAQKGGFILPEELIEEPAKKKDNTIIWLLGIVIVILAAKAILDKK